MATPHEFRLKVNGVELQLYEWPGDGPAIFLAHATGFHARCWDAVVEKLPGRRVVALDMRGHGRSAKPEPPYRWADFGHDLAAVVRELDLRDAIGVGHSKGGYALTYAAGLEPGAFGRLLLLDPVIMPKARYKSVDEHFQDHFAARRRNEWSSPQEMYESFKPRPPFNTWDDRVLRDYCNYGLLPNPHGEGYVLACPPHIEAAVYAGGSSGGEIYDLIAKIDIPVRVMRAARDGESRPGGRPAMNTSPTAPDLAAYFTQGQDVPLPQYNHFIPMEAPAFVAAEVLRD